jgi:hypothetical protein
VLATAASRRAVFPPELSEVVPPLEHAANATAADTTNARRHWI